MSKEDEAMWSGDASNFGHFEPMNDIQQKGRRILASSCGPLFSREN